jgi:glycosyltransferase involved in cell wall biosynthesis
MSQGKPVISVIIPNFNRGDLLPQTLESLLSQDFPNWEALVVDDRSTDGSLDITAKFAAYDSRISLIKRDRNPSGAPTCRNIGINQSKGDFLIFLDSDDLLLPFALSRRLEFASKENTLDYWVFPMLMFRNDPDDATNLWNVDNGQNDLYRFLVLDAPWQTSGPMWKKEAVVKIGGFTEGLACWQDVDFHLKALGAGLKGKKFYNLTPDALYRQHAEGSVSQDSISSPEKLRSRMDIFIRNTLSLKALMNDEIAGGLRIIGGNIAVGSARAINAGVSRQVISFGKSAGIFQGSTAAALYGVMLFYQFRLFRIKALEKQLEKYTRQYRQDSNIGKHPYRKEV